MNVVVAAHPDDEVIGLGAHLPCLREAIFVHLTDGAPRNMRDAVSHGFRTRQDYAAARKQELFDALAQAQIPSGQCRHLDCPDQEASQNLCTITRFLYDVFRESRPDYILTHPYEGGHPDHDAAAFACHAARALLIRDGICPGLVLEFTSYHARDGMQVTGEFLPCASRPPLTISLTPAQQAFKLRLFSCFPTQRGVLAGFPVHREAFRVAPSYDFDNPPHAGTLYYEMFEWGMTGDQWRALARAALCQLDLC
jgi:N-acetylglucosamine malate deacetylase 2